MKLARGLSPDLKSKQNPLILIAFRQTFYILKQKYVSS